MSFLTLRDRLNNAKGVSRLNIKPYQETIGLYWRAGRRAVQAGSLSILIQANCNTTKAARIAAGTEREPSLNITHIPRGRRRLWGRSEKYSKIVVSGEIGRDR